MEHAQLIESEWPTVTATLLAGHEKLEQCYKPEEINQGIFALIKARKAIFDAHIAVHAAKKHFVDKPHVKERLSLIGNALMCEHDNMPLTVVDNGGGHERPPIMK